MITAFDIPQLNPLKFYPQWDKINIFANTILANINPNYQHRHMDSDFMIRGLKSWQNEVEYYQPFQQSDVITLHFGASDIGLVTYALLDCEGNVYKTQSFSSIDNVGGIEMYFFQLELFDIDEGIYFLQMRCEKSSKNYAVISEPIEVKTIHENTMLFEYTNSTNQQSVIWSLVPNQTMNFRVHCAFTEMEAKAKLYVYENQNYDTTLLSATPYRDWALSFGGDGYGVPEWMADKINRVFSCDNVLIDGKEFTRLDSAQLEAKRIANHPLQGYTLKVREKTSNADTEIFTDFQCKLMQLPNTKDFYVESLGGYTIQRGFTSLAMFINYLNTTFKRNNLPSYIGKFTIDSENYLHYYSTTTSEVTAISSYTMLGLLPYMFEVSFVNDAPTGGLKYDIDLPTKGRAIIFSTGVVITHAVVTGVYHLLYNPIFTPNVTAKIYIEDATEITDVNSFNNIYEIGGELPPSCAILNLKLNSVCVKNNIFLQCNGALTDVFFEYSGLITNEHNKILIHLHEALQIGGLLLSGGSSYLASGTYSQPSNDSGIKEIISDLTTSNFNILI